jgi:hypothetical protein
LDNLNPEANERYSKAIFDFFNTKLGVPGDRGYVSVILLPGRLQKADQFGCHSGHSLILAEASWGELY